MAFGLWLMLLGFRKGIGLGEISLFALFGIGTGGLLETFSIEISLFVLFGIGTGGLLETSSVAISDLFQLGCTCVMFCFGCLGTGEDCLWMSLFLLKLTSSKRSSFLVS